MHVLGVVFWIGGVAFVTTVLIPSLKKIVQEGERVKLFEVLEHSFSWQAKISTLLTGFSGFYMLYFMGAWDRFLQFKFWWMTLMLIVWVIFSLILFVLEPLFLHDWFRKKAGENPTLTLKRILRGHRVLLVLSLIAVFGAVLGSHGLLGV